MDATEIPFAGTGNHAGTPVGPNDLRIAAHAVHLGATLVTGKKRSSDAFRTSGSRPGSTRERDLG